MVRLLMSFILVFVATLPTFSQTRIGFTNLDGFPDVLVHQSYNLSAWIKNNGTTTISGNIDVRMQVNGGNSHQIDNNFTLPAALAPGDSVLWTKNGYNFPYGQFAPGQNDVLIWPTKSSGSSQSDTLKKPIYFADGAAFSMTETGLEELLAGGIDIDQSYETAVVAQNIGESANDNPVGFFLQIGNEAPVLLRQREQATDPSQLLSCEIQLPALRSHLEARYGPLPVGFSIPVHVYAEEVDGLPYYAAQSMSTKTLVLAAVSPAVIDGGPLLYPVPSQDGILQLDHTGSLFKQMRVAKLFGADGRLLAAYDRLGQTLDLSALAPGHYLLQIESRSGETCWRKIVLQ